MAFSFNITPVHNVLGFYNSAVIEHRVVFLPVVLKFGSLDRMKLNVEIDGCFNGAPMKHWFQTKYKN